MEALAAVTVIIILLTGCSSNEEWKKGPELHINGDSQSIGAYIYIDGQKVGVMKKEVYTGPKPNEEDIKKHHELQKRLGITPTNPIVPGDVFAVGIDLRIAEGKKKPEYGILKDIRASMGKHEILFLNKEGKRLTKEIKVQSENYLRVDFGKMFIRGGE